MEKKKRDTNFVCKNNTILSEQLLLEAKAEDIDSIVRIHNQSVLMRDKISEKKSGFLLNKVKYLDIENRMTSNFSTYYICKSKSGKHDEVIAYLEVMNNPNIYFKDIFEEIEWFGDDLYSILYHHNHIHILTIAINNKYRGMGIGSFVYDSFKKKYPKSILSAFVSEKPYFNKGSFLFHKKNGFEANGYYYAKEFEGLKKYKSKILIKRPSCNSK
jgi:L-amino acid N-acyltransferase YncA